MKKYQNVAKQFEYNIQELEVKSSNILNLTEQGINYTRQVLDELRDLVIKENFDNTENEIQFFKEIKPKILSKFIYYLKLFSTENKRPLSSIKAQIKFLNTEIDKLQIYFLENREFYNYYRRADTRLDEHYFIRNHAQSMQIHIDTFHFFIDKRFSTSHDAMVATIIAYELLIEYLKKEVNKLKNNSITTNVINSKRVKKLNWTGSKTDAIELIYALHAGGMINNGNSDINEIKEIFEELFGIKIGDPYRTFLNIRIRKINRTKLIDFLKDSLLKYIEKLDE